MTGKRNGAGPTITMRIRALADIAEEYARRVRQCERLALQAMHDAKRALHPTNPADEQPLLDETLEQRHLEVVRYANRTTIARRVFNALRKNTPAKLPETPRKTRTGRRP